MHFSAPENAKKSERFYILNQQKTIKRKLNKAAKDATKGLNEDDFDFNEGVEEASDSAVNTFIAKFGGSGNQNNSLKRKSSPKSSDVEKRINNRS